MYRLEQGSAPAVLFEQMRIVFAFDGRMLVTEDKEAARAAVEAGAELLEGNLADTPPAPSEPLDEPTEPESPELPFNPNQFTKTEIKLYMLEEEEYELDDDQTKVEMVAECMEYFALKDAEE